MCTVVDECSGNGYILDYRILHHHKIFSIGIELGAMPFNPLIKHESELLQIDLGIMWVFYQPSLMSCMVVYSRRLTLSTPTCDIIAI